MGILELKLDKKLKHLIGKKVVGIKDSQIYFEDNTLVECNEYETYIMKFNKTDNKHNLPTYYLKSWWDNYSNEELKTSEEWKEELYPYMEIIDYDGWDRKNLVYSFYEEKITKNEFETKIAFSTIIDNKNKKRKETK